MRVHRVQRLNALGFTALRTNAGSVDDGYDAWNDPYHIVLLVLRISLLLGIMPILLVLMTLGMLVVVMLFGLVIFMILLAMTTGL